MINKNSISIKLQKMLEPYFSCQGTLDRSAFLGIMVSLYLLLKISMEQSIILYDILYWPVFYLTLVTIQKRCRDIKWNGTFFIMLYSIAFPFINYYQYMKLNDIVISQHLNNVIVALSSMYFISYIVLLLVPGKNIKDKNVQSFLLTYPIIYSGICFILFLVGQYFFIFK